MEPVEIHLNRRGINSIEVPAKVEVETGSLLTLHIINHAAPIHVTVSSSNSALFTSFYHQNLYIQDALEFPIPIKEEAYAGFFDLNIITGYGTRKSTFRVFVTKPEKVEPPVQEAELPPPVAISQGAWILVVLLLVAAIGYGAWLLTREEILNYIAFIAVLGGVIVAWYFQR